MPVCTENRFSQGGVEGYIQELVRGKVWPPVPYHLWDVQRGPVCGSLEAGHFPIPTPPSCASSRPDPAFQTEQDLDPPPRHSCSRCVTYSETWDLISFSEPRECLTFTRWHSRGNRGSDPFSNLPTFWWGWNPSRLLGPEPTRSITHCCVVISMHGEVFSTPQHLILISAGAF